MTPTKISFQNYKHYKSQVIRLFEDISTLVQADTNKHLIQYLKKRVDNLKKDEFIIAVAGEVKAGNQPSLIVF